MELLPELQIEVTSYSDEPKFTSEENYDFDQIIYDLNSQISLLSSNADKLDYLVSAASGILCSALDILWVGDLQLERGREIAGNEVENVVKKISKSFGGPSDDLPSAVNYLEKMFPLASDGNAAEFGGGLQHHLRDFAHHPTLVGLIFSLLTQFTCKAYGTDTAGNFLILDIPEKSRVFIGKDIPQKILYGTVIWFFHLVSDMAGSGKTAGRSGGTGIPGPILSLAKEISAIPFFKKTNKDGNSLSEMISKLFNGTLLARHDENGKIIKGTELRFDLRAELGIAVELGRLAVPVIANECIVRCFYLIRRLGMEIKRIRPASLEDFRKIDWDEVKPGSNPTISRMLTIATGVFTTIDIGEAIATKKYWVSINYIGVGRFALAIGEDVSWGLKTRRLKRIREAYVKIKDNADAFREQRKMGFEKFGLTLEQTEILYNIEYYKTRNDAEITKTPLNTAKIQQLKLEWLDDWKRFISAGFSSFTQIPGAQMHWYSKEELLNRIENNNPEDTWFRLVLLEAMLFEPYYALKIVEDKKGKEIPDPRFKELQGIANGFKQGTGDEFLENFFSNEYYQTGYVKRLRKCYNSVIRELNEVQKTVIVSLTVAAVITIAAIVTAGTFAPSIAVALVGSNFAGLHGAALTSACLAYLGGGAIAAGGAGMAGGFITIVGGGAVLGLGAGAAGGVVGAAGLFGKRGTSIQSAKLLTAVLEIFLNDEHDIEYANLVLEKYVQNIVEIEKELVDLKWDAETADKEERKKLKSQIKNVEDSIETMKIARKSLAKFIASYDSEKS